MSVLPSGVRARKLVIAEFVRMARTWALVSVSQSRITPSPLAVGRKRQSRDISGVSRQRVEQFAVRQIFDKTAIPMREKSRQTKLQTLICLAYLFRFGRKPTEKFGKFFRRNFLFRYHFRQRRKPLFFEIGVKSEI